MTTVEIGRFQAGAVIGQSFETLFRNIATFGAISAILTLPLLAFYVYTGGLEAELQQMSLRMESDSVNVDMDAFWAIIRLTLILTGGTLTIYFAVSMLATAAMSYGTFEFLRGSRRGIGECLAKGLSLLLPALGVAAVSSVAFVIGSILLLVPAIILAVMWYVVIPVTVVERPGVFASFRRSAALTKGCRWKIFGILLVGVAVGIGIGIPAGIVALAFPGNIAANAILSWLSAVIGLPVGAVLGAVTYYHLRQAKEGAAIADIAAVFD
jgi:hypothetical protein